MAKPKVDYFDLESAFMAASYDFRYWLDRQTGEVISYSAPIARALEEGEDLSDLSGWDPDEIKAARKVLRAFGELPDEEEDKGSETPAATQSESETGIAGYDPTRFARIEPIPSDEAFRFMEAFIGTVNDARARQALERALRGGHPFRRFKDALSDFPEQRKRWHDFQDRRTRHYIEEWARDQEVEI